MTKRQREIVDLTGIDPVIAMAIADVEQRIKRRSSVVQAISVAGPRGEMVPVEGIRLRKEGEHTVVDAEIGGDWVEVIRERSDGNFCHIVEASGMFSAYYALPRNGG